MSIGETLRSVRAVFFDAVGTTIRPEPPVAEVYAAVGRAHGISMEPETLRKRFNEAFALQEAKDQQDENRTSEARERRRWHEIVAHVFEGHRLAEPLFEELWNHFAEPSSWRAFADVEACFAVLRECGLVIGLASNFDGRLRRLANGLGPLRHVSHLAISSEIGWRKPSPRFFAAVAEMCGMPPKEILLVGDDEINDYQGAVAAGMRAILLNRDGTMPQAHAIATLGQIVAEYSGR